MENNYNIIDNIINSSKKFKNTESDLKWKYKYGNSKIIQYHTIYKLSGRKHLYLILTKRKVGNDGTNIFLDIYYTSKKSGFIDLKIKPKNLPNYNYSHVKSIYLNAENSIIKLYSIIKYMNNLQYFVGEEKFIDNYIYWTKKGFLKWEKDNHNNFICYDLKNVYGCDLYIKVIKNGENNSVLYVHLDGKQFYPLITGLECKNLYDIIEKNN